MERDPFMKNIIRSLHLRIVDKEVSAVISRETGGNRSRSPHEMESENPGPVNGRWSIRTTISERLRVDILAL
jgi:hypothetical protein